MEILLYYNLLIFCGEDDHPFWSNICCQVGNDKCWVYIADDSDEN